MTQRELHLKVTLRLYSDDDQRCFGPGIATLLERVREHHSLRAGAASMEMAYSKAWRIIRTAEGVFGCKLLSSTIGGSGGGYRFSSTLGSDYTHSAMELWLDEKVSHCIYGKNGHLWSKLVCGRKGGALVINVPGPIREAAATIAAFAESAREGRDIRAINEAMTRALYAQYPQDKVQHDE